MKKTKQKTKDNQPHPLVVRLAELAESSGIVRAQLAERAGMSPMNLYPILSGKRGITIETFQKLCDALGAKIEINLK